MAQDAHSFALPAVAAASSVISGLSYVVTPQVVAALGASYLTLSTWQEVYESYRTIQECLRGRSLVRALHEAQECNQEPELGVDAQIKTLFVHGLGFGGKQQMAYYTKHNIFITDDVCMQDNQSPIFFDFQDAGFVAPSYLGQHADIKKLKEEYDRLVSQNCKVRLYGLSRGAATIINFLAIYKPKNVICAVIESPFDDLETIVQHKLNMLGIGYIPFVGSATSACITQLVTIVPLPKQIDLRNHSVFDTYPKDVVHEIPHTIPLLFISSQEDWVIPYYSTQNLVDLIKAHGHKHCHHEICACGGHADILAANKDIHATIKSFLKDPANFFKV